MSTTSILGAVLVGGRSRRMGRDKALIEIDGRPLVERAATLLESVGCRPVVSIGPVRLAGRVTAVNDRYPGEGPLGGILTALGAAVDAGAEAAFVVACDLPDLAVEPLLAMATAFGRAIPTRGSATGPPRVVMATSGRLEPLCALWDIRCLGALQDHFEAGTRAVHRALGGLTVVQHPIDSALMRNVNLPGDLRND